MKNLAHFQLIIWDLDGTLYYQKEFRCKMAKVMIKELCFKPKRWKELFLVLYYRRLREIWDISDVAPDLETRQYQKAGEKFGFSTDIAKKIVENWMQNIPLYYLGEFRDDTAAEIILKLQREKKKVVVYSDYPTEEKLEALGVWVENSFSPLQPEIGCLKPNPKGLNFIIKKYGIEKSKVLMIGDRLEKDGKAALAAGIQYEILPRHRKKRKKYYEENGIEERNVLVQ